MPVTTRQSARTFASQSASTSQDRQHEFSQAMLAPAIATSRHEIARTKAEAISRYIQPSTFESLPTEIIELIAEKLRDQELAEDDINVGDFYEAVSEATCNPPPCECEHVDHSVPFDRKSRESRIAELGIRSCEPTIPLSSTSRRLRSIVFYQCPDRVKVVKYCKSSMQASEAMSVLLRESVR